MREENLTEGASVQILLPTVLTCPLTLSGGSEWATVGRAWLTSLAHHPQSLFFFLLGPHLRHMEVPRLGVESELQLPAYTTAAATQDWSRVCDLHHSSWQCQILNPLIEAKDRTCILMETM